MNLKIVACISLLIALKSVNNTYAQNTDSSITSGQCCYNCCRPDGHAPLGVMTDHIHGKGEWTVAYNYMDMLMNGSMQGSSKVNSNQVLNSYMMAPAQMSMQMHMLMLMYGITSRFTIMGMGTYMSNNMTMQMSSLVASMPGMDMPAGATSMQSRSQGFGDASIYGLYNAFDKNGHRIIAGLGASLPTGSTTVAGMTLFGDNKVLPYGMQTGTGSFSSLPSIVYEAQNCNIGWGAAADANIKLNTNTEGYRWGNAYNITAWGSYRFFSMLSGSLRVQAEETGKITGYDPQIEKYRIAYDAMGMPQEIDPTANPANYGGFVANTYIGLNFYVDKSSLKQNRLSVEYGIPVYQNLNGIQPRISGSFEAGWLYSF